MRRLEVNTLLVVSCLGIASGNACVFGQGDPAGQGLSAGDGIDPGESGASSAGADDTATPGDDAGDSSSASSSDSKATSSNASKSGSESSKDATPSDASDSDSDGSNDASDDDVSDPHFDLGPVPDHDIEPRGCDIDFLFVIDNSGSMGDEQDNLARSVPRFVDTVTSEIPNLESIHLGVITTQAYRENSANCRSMGALVTQTAGSDSSNSTCTPFASGHNFMTEADDLDQTFGCAAKPGTGDGQYGDERPMEALQKALAPELSQPGACNEQFLRDDALLVVTVISDEEDDPELGGRGSPGDPADWYADLLAAKQNTTEKIVVLGLIGSDASTECEPLVETGAGNVLTGAEKSPRLESFVELFEERGFIGDVCAADYDQFFKEAVAVIDFACDALPEG